MARSDQDYLFLKSLQKILLKEDFPSQLLSELYDALFNNRRPPQALWHPVIEKWESVVIARSVNLIGEISAKYVQLFYDPKQVPVTHSWKQKQLAVFLDEQFSTILWEAVKRTGPTTSGYHVYDEIEKDDFLDKPILYLKDEARDRKFPSINKRPSLAAIQERFLDKAKSSGMNLEKLEHEGFHSLE